MAPLAVALTAFNRGEVSRLALGRVDVDKLRLAAEEQVNWVPLTLGPMQVRPGLQYVGGTAGNQQTVTIPFVYSVVDTALLEQAPGQMRVLIDDAPLIRPATASSFPAGQMVDPSLWTFSYGGAGSAVVQRGALDLDVPSIGGSSVAQAEIGVGSPGVQHALRITITRGPVRLLIGTGAGLDDVFRGQDLDVGTHSIAFTPAGNVFVQFELRHFGNVEVQGALLEPAGVMILPTPWQAGELALLRWDQSADVVFVACAGHEPVKIARPSPGSWSITQFRPDDGPFQANTPTDCTLAATPQAGSGIIQLSASRPVFRAGHAGCLVRGFSPNANLTFGLGSATAGMPAVRVSGVGISRTIAWNVSGSFTGSWELQRSLTGPDEGFATVAAPVLTNTGTSNNPNYVYRGGTPGPGSSFTGTGAGSGSLQDDLDNVVVWYRLACTGLTSGIISASIIHGGSGGRTGVYRITSVIDPQTAVATILVPPSSDNPSDNWQFGDWSNDAGWPTALALFDGRLGFAGGDRLWLSVSDAFDSFADTLADGTTVGDSSSIARSIGYGPVATINWMLPLSRLLLGTAGSEVSVRSSALDSPLTPTGGMAIRDCSTFGSSPIPAAKVDTRGVFSDRAGRRVIQLAYDVNSQDYGATDLTRLHPDLNLGNSVTRIVVQRHPNTRIHCLRADGTVAVLLFEPSDEVAAWYRIETAGIVEDMCVLPGAIEDVVYYVVNRNGVRCRERFARLDQARGGTLNLMADAHVIYQGVLSRQIGGLSHLNGQTVCLWGDGHDLGTAVVQNGIATLPNGAAASNICAGLPYQARWTSAKLAYGAPQGQTALNRRKRPINLGLVLADAHNQGLWIGQDAANLDPLPLVEDDALIDPTAGQVAFDEQSIPLPGRWDTDARLRIYGQAPRPCTVMAASLSIEASV